MEKINDVLYYLNKLEFIDIINDKDLDNLRRIKRNFFSEFEDYIIYKLFDVLSTVDKFFYYTYSW